MYTEPHQKWVRVVMFIALSVTGLIPFCHFAALYGLDGAFTVIDWK